MTTKTQKLNSIEISKTFYETKWSTQSVTTYNQKNLKKLFEKTKLIETSNDRD